MDERDPLIDRAIETLRESVRLDPGLDRRVMEEVERAPAPRIGAQRWWSAWEWLRRGRTVTVSPLGGLAAAAALAALLLAGRWGVAWMEDSAAPTAVFEAAAVQFVLVAPGASMVTVVGDFNDWSATATPLNQVSGDGMWTVTVPLPPGRYRYGFLVDGTEWVRDPSTPPALDDDFGRPNSVVTVRGS
jgi:hypothetical protein